ncbi:MAG: carboxypeptidase regulatory-like domain-containing protein [Fibrobacteria bacterium]|nr:carboxypeptidase regulatory-like domain-containing protein [Fibrobacteria bacterium]
MCLFFAGNLFSQDILIKGSVFDEFGGPISSAVVRLAVSGLEDTTDTSGYYELKRIATGVDYENRISTDQAVYNAFDLLGRKLYAGNDRQFIHRKFQHSVYILRSPNEPIVAPLVKSSVFLDTMIVTAEGYLTTTSVIDKATDSIDITLSKVVIENRLQGLISGDILAGVTINITEADTADTVTNTDGVFAFSGLKNGTYTVTPSLANYTFTPESRQVTLAGEEKTDVNFVATILTLPTVSRFQAVMDNGTYVTVDNISNLTEAAVGNLVLAADRSTQEDCPYDATPHKGLFQAGDRIVVTDYYLAWFDYTTNDGLAFAKPPYSQNWERSGSLAGWWTLNPATGTFRYNKIGPNGCGNWAHNELIPGSASPSQEQHWWDKFSPPLEHTVVFPYGDSYIFTSYPYAKQGPNSDYVIKSDGQQNAQGLHYVTNARMTSWKYAIDVTDENDQNGISNYLVSSMEYICRARDVKVIWKVMPGLADVTVNNLYIFLWTAYSGQDMDGTSCDFTGGSQWPGTVYGHYRYTQSSLSLRDNWGTTAAPNQVMAMKLGDVCSDPYVNIDVVTRPLFEVTDGSYIRIGESPTLAQNFPRWQLTVLGEPGAGAGTYEDPENFTFAHLINWNETHDGTLGFGVGRGPFNDPKDYFKLTAGRWYQSVLLIGTNF